MATETEATRLSSPRIFLIRMLVFLVLVTYLPALSTALPYALMGPEIVAR